MRQNVIFSTLAVAVAPVAAMAEGAVYQNVKAPQAVTASTEVSLLKTTAVDKVSDYKFTFESTVDLTGSTVTVNGEAATLTDLGLGKYEVEVPAALTDENKEIELKITPSNDGSISNVLLEPIDPNKIKDLLDGTPSYFDKVDDYMNNVKGEGYTLSKENLATLLLLHDICVPGSEQYTVANFERFNLYSGNLDEIEDAFAKMVSSIEQEEAALQIKDAKEIVADENAGEDLKEAINDLKDLEEALKEAAEKYENGEISLAELKEAKAKVMAQADYTEWLLTADKARQGIDAIEALLKEYDQSVKDGDAKLSTDEINIFRNSPKRKAGLAAVLDEFKTQAEADMTADATVFNAPTNIEVEIDVDGLGPQLTNKFADIAALLGTDPEPAAEKTQFFEKGVLNNLAALKYCAAQYQAKYDEVKSAIEKANTDYYAQISDFQLNFQSYAAKDPSRDYNDALGQVVTKFHDDFVKDNAGIEGVEKALEAAKKAGLPISFVKDNNDDGWCDVTAPTWTDATTYVPAQLWNKQLADVKTELAAAIAYWEGQAAAAYAEYTKEKDLIEGDDDDTKLLKLVKNLDWDNVEADVKAVKNKVGGDYTTTYQEDYDAILADIEDLKVALDATSKELTDPVADFALLNDPWKANWNNVAYGDDDADKYASYANLKKRLEELKTKIDSATDEYNAYQDLLLAADELATRLKTASDLLDESTKDLDPAYKPSEKFSALTKTVTDYVAALKEYAKDAYADGLGTDARDLLSGDNYKDDDILDTSDPADTPDYDWNDANAAVERVETGGDIALAVANFIKFYEDVAQDEADKEEFLAKVKDHDIYKLDNPFAADNTNGNKYKTNVKAWEDYIKVNGTDEIANDLKLDGDTHFTAIGAPLTYKPFDIDKQLNRTEPTIDDEIQKDKDNYDLQVLKRLVHQHVEDLWGTDGKNPATKDSYIDDVLDQLEAQKNAVYEALIDGKDPKDVFGEFPKAADLGDYTTVAVAWDAMKTAIETLSDDLKTAYTINPKVTLADWNDLNDQMLAFKDQLDAFMSDGTATNINKVVIDETTCIQKLVDFTNKIADNKAAYDGLLDIWGKLTKRVENLLKDLKDPALYEETNEGKALIDILENYFKPIPPSQTAKIEQLFKDCKAVSEGPTSTRVDDIDEYEAYRNDALNALLMSTESDKQVAYWILRDALTQLEDLYKAFDGNYDNYLAAKNLAIFDNQVVGAYDAAMSDFNKAVSDLNEFFATPKDPELLEKFKEEFAAATLIIYQAPKALNAERAEAEDNMDAANVAGDTYDPAADIADIKAIQKSVVDAFNDFVAAMETKLGAIYAFRATGYQDIIDAAFKNIDDHDYLKKADGTKLEDDGIAVVFQEEMDIMDDFAADQTMNLVITPDQLTTGDFANFLAFDDILVNQLKGIEASVIDKMNTYANADLTSEINAKKAADVLVDAQTLMGKYIEKTKADNTVAKLGEVEYTPDLDADGNPIPVDMMEKYDVQYTGFGDKTDKNGNYYSYKRALGETAYNALVAEFDELVATTVGAAEALNKEYFDAKKLPMEGDYTGNDQRQEVLDLLGEYTAAKFDAILAKAKTAYDEYINDADYIILMDEFESRFKTDSAGIASLYVGSQEHFVDELKWLSKDFAQEKKEKTNLANMQSLVNRLDALILEAKQADYNKMKKELVEMKNEYNQMISDLGLQIDAETDATKKAALEAQRDKLVQAFAYGAKSETDPNFTDEMKKLAHQMDIDENVATLEDYQDRITLSPDDQSNDATYAEYVAVEHNVGLIKTAIAIVRGEETAESIAQIGTDLLKRVNDLLEMKSKYFNTEMLVLDPENPEADGYLFSDFGLFQNYTDADYKDYLARLETYEVNELNSILAAIQSHIDAGDILLFKANLDNEIKKHEAGGLWAVEDIDYHYNENLDDANESRYESNQKLLAAAANQKVQYERLLDELKDTNDKLAQAKTDIAGLGLVDKDGNAITGDFATIEKVIGLLTLRAKLWYLACPLTDEMTLKKNTYTKPDIDAQLYKYLSGQEITDEWLEQWGITDAYDKATGKVTLKGTKGLNLINIDIADEVQKWVNEKASQKYDEAEAAYDEALALLNSTEMRTEDKEALRNKLYGSTIANKKDGGFQEDLAGLEDDKVTQDITTIAAYVDAVDAFVKALKGDGVDAGFEDEIASYLAGDFDGNGTVNVIDLTELLNLVNNPGTQKDLTDDEFKARDLNNDGYIDVVDLGIMVDIITGDTGYLYADGTFSARAAARSNESLHADVMSNEGNVQRIAISLDNENEYTSFQMDVTLPQGMRLAGQSLSGRANGQQLYANEWDGKIRVVGFTMSKNAFNGNDGALLYLDVETDETYKGGSIRFEDILFVTTNNKGVRFNMTGDATSIKDRLADAAKSTIYNVGGRMMNSLKKGVNIIRSNGKTEKVIKK